MASSGTAVVSLPSDTEILITREFDAPKHLVYKAFTTPELIKRWWSAKRGEVTLVEVELRVGGKWRFVMVTEGGFEVGFHGEYREIIPNEMIVNTEVYEGVAGGDENAAVNTTRFVEEAGRTTLTVLVTMPNKEGRDMILESGMEAGMQDAYDLLEEVAISLN